MTTSWAHYPDAMGIRQYAVIALGQRRVDILSNILNHLSFCQSLVFVAETDRINHMKKALSPFKPLSLCGGISFDERKKVTDEWRKFGSRVMLLTDTASKGFDDRIVNLVFNLNLPGDCTTYMQRIVRAYFTDESGAAITILTTQQDATTFLAMVKNDSLTVKFLDVKNEFPRDLTYNQSYVQAMDFVEYCENAQIDVEVIATHAPEEHEPSKQADVKDSVAASKIEESGKKVIAEDVASLSESEEPSKKVYAGDFVSPKTESGKEAIDDVNVSLAAQTQEATKTIDGGVKASDSASSISLSGNESENGGHTIPAQQNSRKSSNQPQMTTNATPPHLPLINVDVVRLFFPDFEYDIEAATVRAVEARKNNPGVPNEPPFNYKKRSRSGFGSKFCGLGFGGGNGSGLSFRDINGEHGRGTNAAFGSNSGGFGNGQENVGGFGEQSGGEPGGFGNDQENFGSFGERIGPRKFYKSTDEGDIQIYDGQGGGERGDNVGRFDGNRRDEIDGQANIPQNGNHMWARLGITRDLSLVSTRHA